jgi:hypothetical protein
MVSASGFMCAKTSNRRDRRKRDTARSHSASGITVPPQARPDLGRGRDGGSGRRVGSHLAHQSQHAIALFQAAVELEGDGRSVADGELLGQLRANEAAGVFEGLHGRPALGFVPHDRDEDAGLANVSRHFHAGDRGHARDARVLDLSLQELADDFLDDGREAFAPPWCSHLVPLVLSY